MNFEVISCFRRTVTSGHDGSFVCGRDDILWFAMNQDEFLNSLLSAEFTSVHARSKKLIIDDCYRISHLISSDIKLISTWYHDFYCCIFFRKKRSCISGNCYVECKLYIYLLTFDTLCIQKTS